MEEKLNLSDFEGSGQEDGASQPERSSRWSQEQRLEFIDFRLAWEGKINRSDLTGFFGISVPQASLDLARYKAMAPDNCKYDLGQKVYLRSDSFTTNFSSSGPSHYLNDLLALSAGVISPEGSYLGWKPPFDTLPTPGRNLSSSILYSLLFAIREKKKMHIEYMSFSRTESTVRQISPHALSNDGFRWHVRAFCHTRNAFLDFVIARILRHLDFEDSGLNGEGDKAWNNFLTLDLVPHPELPEPHRKAVEYDYAMTDGRIELKCREALIFYALRRLGLDQESTLPLNARHLFLANRDEVEGSLSNRIERDGAQLSLWNSDPVYEE